MILYDSHIILWENLGAGFLEVQAPVYVDWQARIFYIDPFYYLRSAEHSRQDTGCKTIPELKRFLQTLPSIIPFNEDVGLVNDPTPYLRGGDVRNDHMLSV